MTKPFEVEVSATLYAEGAEGWRLVVAPDRDGLGMVELRYEEHEGKAVGWVDRSNIVIPREAALALIDALRVVLARGKEEPHD